MSAARPLSPLLSALSGAAVVALTLAAPGTALADPGNGSGGKDAGPNHGQSAHKAQDRPADQPPAAEPAQAKASKDKGAAAKPAERQPAKDKAPKGKPAKDEPAPAQAPAQSARAGAGAGSPDPAGNNGTIKIDTVPADTAKANRPHPGCAFTVEFFDFDAGQTADITFTGQAPTRSAGPLLSLSGQTISTTPADGALEEGHSLVLSAADLGLIGTPTAAKGWHVKVAVDALEAPGGAKQKVFWLDCPAGEPAAVLEESDESADATTDEATLAPAGALSPVAADHALRAFGDDEVVVLSESATRELAAEQTAEATASARGEQATASTGDATLAAAAADADGASTSVLPSVLPFTGAAGIAAMLAAGLGAVAAGALALRAGRRRTATSTDLT